MEAVRVLFIAVLVIHIEAKHLFQLLFSRDRVVCFLDLCTLSGQYFNSNSNSGEFSTIL